MALFLLMITGYRLENTETVKNEEEAAAASCIRPVDRVH